MGEPSGTTSMPPPDFADFPDLPNRARLSLRLWSNGAVLDHNIVIQHVVGTVGLVFPDPNGSHIAGAKVGRGAGESGDGRAVKVDVSGARRAIDLDMELERMPSARGHRATGLSSGRRIVIADAELTCRVNEHMRYGGA